jgi:hypothetical protein
MSCEEDWYILLSDEDEGGIALLYLLRFAKKHPEQKDEILARIREHLQQLTAKERKGLLKFAKGFPYVESLQEEDK